VVIPNWMPSKLAEKDPHSSRIRWNPVRTAEAGTSGL